MKRRILSAVLCAALMLTLLPLAAYPARMVASDLYVTVNRTSATVGDVLVWTMNVVPDGAHYQTRIKVFAGSTLVYNGLFTTGRVHSYTTETAGPHHAEVIAYDNNDGNELSVDSAVTTVNKLTAPTLTSATAASARSVRLSWTPIAGVDGYKVLRATSSSGPYSLAGYATSTSFTKTYLTPGTRYWFKVCAYNEVAGAKREVSNFSAAKIAVPIGAAIIKTIASPAKGSIKLTWDATPGASGYEIYRAVAADGPYTRVKTTSSLSFTNSGLTSATVYFYKIVPYKRLYSVNYYGAASTPKYVRVK